MQIETILDDVLNTGNCIIDLEKRTRIKSLEIANLFIYYTCTYITNIPLISNQHTRALLALRVNGMVEIADLQSKYFAELLVFFFNNE